MSSGVPLGTLIYGNLDLAPGYNTAGNGLGSLGVSNNIYVNGTSASTSSSSGCIVAAGGLGIGGDSNLAGKLDVSSTSTLMSTYVNLGTSGTFNVSGGGSANIAVGSPSTFSVTGGGLTLMCSGGASSLLSSNASPTAINIGASNVAGGVQIGTGVSGVMAVGAGAGGMFFGVSSGPMSSSVANGSMTFTVNSTGGAQSILMNVNSTGGAQIKLSSNGTGTGLNSGIRLSGTSAAGSIILDNAGGTGGGSISLLAGSGGCSITAFTGGSIGLTSSSAGINITTNTFTADQNLTIASNGLTTSGIVLTSMGIGNAVSVLSSGTAGNILISNNTAGSGGISIGAGLGGVRTISNGITDFTTNNAQSSFVNKTNAAGQDMSFLVDGTTGSKLNLFSVSPVAGSITMLTTGGISMTSSQGGVQVQSSDAVNGIQLGTAATVPITLGTPASTTTVNGNLNVKGTTTTVNSTVMTVTDNIIQVNNGPAGLADGGLAIKRYQTIGNSGGNTGEVTSDTPYSSGSTAQGGTTNTITLAASDSNVDGFYNGWWIWITSGTGSGQVRRIKTYLNSGNIATIYTTADQINPLVLDNTIPAEGADFATAPGTTSVYSLYPNEWVVSMWDYSKKEYALIYSSDVSGLSPTPQGYVNFHAGQVTCTNLATPIINGGMAEYLTTVTLADNSYVGVAVPGVPAFGVYRVLVQPPSNHSGTRPLAAFTVAKGAAGNAGTVIRDVSIGIGVVLTTTLTMTWAAGSSLKLAYTGLLIDGSTSTTYSVKVYGVTAG